MKVQLIVHVQVEENDGSAAEIAATDAMHKAINDSEELKSGTVVDAFYDPDG